MAGRGRRRRDCGASESMAASAAALRLAWGERERGGCARVEGERGMRAGRYVGGAEPLDSMILGHWI